MTRWIMFAFAALVATGCGHRVKERETPTHGTASVLVDETVFPMVEGVVQVFENQYQYAHLDLMPLPERSIAELLKSDSLRLAVMTRTLTPAEEAWFAAKKITPRITEVAYDGIAIIANRENRDSTITVGALSQLVQGIDTKSICVFDNPASGLVQYIKDFTGADSLSGIYSLRSSSEVIEYVAATPGALGFVGVDWLYETADDNRPYIDRIKVMAVGDDANGYYKPTQNDIAGGNYPLTRKVYLINVQGFAGLGMGFASFIAGDIGQRIILKSGLVPTTYPKREIILRKQL